MVQTKTCSQLVVSYEGLGEGHRPVVTGSRKFIDFFQQTPSVHCQQDLCRLTNETRTPVSGGALLAVGDDDLPQPHPRYPKSHSLGETQSCCSTRQRQ